MHGGPRKSGFRYLLTEDLHLTSLEAETILEAGEFLETMQDYLDSSVISIIEDFSSLTETKGRMDAENELSLLTAITEILDSTDDESLSPFDTIPDSELLTSPRERDNSSFQRFLSLSVTPTEQDVCTIEDFKDPRLCSVVTEKAEACTANLPLALSPSCPKDSATSKKPSNKRRLFRHKEREPPVLQRSDGEEEEEEEAVATSSRQAFGTGVKEIPVASTTKEVELDPAASNGLCVIAPESISLSELVRSMHPYCQPTFTVCLSPNSQPLAKELLDGPVVLEVVSEGGECMEIPVVLQNMEAELLCRIDSNCTTGHVDKEAGLSVTALEKRLPEDNTKTAGLERELDLDKQAEGIGSAALQGIEDAHSGAEVKAKKSDVDQESSSQPGPAAPKNIKVSALEKGRLHTKKRKKSNKKSKWIKEVVNCRLTSACTEDQTGTKPSNPVPQKQLEKAGGQGQDELLPDQESQAVERLDTEMDELLQCELVPPNSLVSSFPCTEEQPSPQLQGSAASLPPDEGDVQREPILLANEMAGSEPSQQLPSSTGDLERQHPRSPLCAGNEDISCPPKEVKPRPLSLSEYRQRRQQHQPRDGGSRSGTENQSASKWPSLPELPTELADLPCLVPPLPTSVAVAKESKKPACSSAAPAPADKASPTPLSVPAPAANPAPRFVLPLQPGSVSTAPSAPIPAISPLPSKVGAFPPVGMQVPSMLPPPYLPSAPGAFLPAPPDSYILSSPPAQPSWPPFAALPTSYQSLPPPLLAAEARPPVFHAIPPVPPLTWPPPPIPLPPFAPAPPYSSVEWAPLPPYWPGIPVPPPPMLPVPYGDQGALTQSPSASHLPALCCSEGSLGQQSTALMPEPSHFRVQSLTASEKLGLPAQESQVQVPSAVKAAPRRVSDPRRQAQSSAAESKAEVTSSSFQPLGKLPSPSIVESSRETTLTQPIRNSSIPQSLGEPPSVPPSQHAREADGPLKSLEEPSFLCALQQPAGKTLALSGPMEKTFTIPAAALSSKEASAVSWPQEEERPSLPAALMAEKLMVPTSVETDAMEAAPTVSTSPASAAPQKAHETSQLSKRPTHMWKYQPLISIAQRSRNKDIVQAFISEIGIEASDLSSLLEQFEKMEAKEAAPIVAKSRENVTAGNDGSEAQREKKMMERLQAPELTNVAGLTPPATPPHQLWKPLAAVTLLGKAGSPKGARLVKSLGKPHRRAPVPIHVGSGEHDYCQLSATQPKGGAQWNVKQNSDITIKPINAKAKEVSCQPATNQLPATGRLDHVGTLSMAAASQNPKESPNLDDAGHGQIKVSSPVATSSSPGMSESSLLGSRPTSSRTEPLDHRTSTPRSMARGSDDPCSVLLSPAASPCRDAEEPTSQPSEEIQQKHLASKRSLRCYRGRQKSDSSPQGHWKGRRTRASRSFSSSSDGDSSSSSSSCSSSSSSASSSRSRYRCPPSKRWRRCCSRSSSSSSCDSSWSRSRGRSRSSSCSSYVSGSSSRSPSPRRSSCRKRYDSNSSRERYQRQKIRYKERAIEERRVVFIGKIPSRMTRSELRHRFSVFGAIEACTLHFREQGDNYGFVTYRYAEDAFAAIEDGHTLCRPDEQPFDLCFGGRRQFCKRNYVDLDSNRDDFEPVPVKSKFDSLDFDTLLKQAQRSLRR
ncbi:peroxisome proliferator-activated receptor gamma coactivator-related protein 1 isoform X2 [Rhineura floridana]|uniref:peroxisome proliferator-activated receptor gamma coactivator-related protein 1 isoform X2 n=1 Tax=Rhineura floridana TaxID=261503 RepID=UPI002AC864FB|nr:peroxisome proliferator-activated receptor gamma coactivator-related protein 1 isoform X2 [Rhineura floridana]